MGAHFVNQELVEDGVFYPSSPEIVLYSQDAGGNWELVGSGPSSFLTKMLVNPILRASPAP